MYVGEWERSGRGQSTSESGCESVVPVVMNPHPQGSPWVHRMPLFLPSQGWEELVGPNRWKNRCMLHHYHCHVLSWPLFYLCPCFASTLTLVSSSLPWLQSSGAHFPENSVCIPLEAPTITSGAHKQTFYSLIDHVSIIFLSHKKDL